MVVSNCVTIKENIAVDVKAVCIMLILLGTMFAYKKITKKDFSPIMLIMVSAILGIGIGAIGI